MIIKTSDDKAVKSIIRDIALPETESHKGQNGKLMIIGGSSLFHSASLWAAEVASHFVDMVHYATTPENERIFHDLKKNFRNGIVISMRDIEEYVSQDDAVLVGPGMMREGQEGETARRVTKMLIDKFPGKKFVFDAGALQMMDKEWLLKLEMPAVITPHQKEFERLFGINLMEKTDPEKEKIVLSKASEYKCVILLKAIRDYVSDGQALYEISGGNAGLTKGGTGDVLAGLTASFLTKNPQLASASTASIILKKAAEALYRTSGYWYNVSDIIKKLPEILKDEVLS